MRIGMLFAIHSEWHYRISGWIRWSGGMVSPGWRGICTSLVGSYQVSLRWSHRNEMNMSHFPKRVCNNRTCENLSSFTDSSIPNDRELAPMHRSRVFLHPEG